MKEERKKEKKQKAFCHKKIEVQAYNVLLMEIFFDPVKVSTKGRLIFKNSEL